jgi:hypothetical protein
MIVTPGHGSLPSGHSTEAFMAATVFWSLLQAAAVVSGALPYDQASWGEQFMRLAARIAINRTVAGVHFPVDSAAGAVLGLTLGHYFVKRAKGEASYDAYDFDGSGYPQDQDFAWRDYYSVDTKSQLDSAAYVRKDARKALDAPGNSAALEWLWGKALAEWA